MSETQLLISFRGRKYWAVQGKHGKILFNDQGVLRPQSTSLWELHNNY